MTQVAEFKVAHLYKPFQGKGLAAIVAEDGTKYKCQESQLAAFEEGEHVAINWETKSFKGKTGEDVTFKKLVSKIAKSNGAAPAKQFTRPSTSKADSEQIFVSALLKEYIGAGMVALDTSALVGAVNKIRSAWHNTFGGSQAQRDDGLEDEIPF